MASDEARTNTPPEGPAPSEADLQDHSLDETRSFAEISHADTAPIPGGAESTSPDDLPIPRVLGDYEILVRIASGGMGDVYRARHRRLGRIVAIKLIKPAYVQSAAAVGRFTREMQAVGRLDHPNIVQALDARQEQKLHILVMEYVEGDNVASLLRRHGSFPVNDACEVGRQTALALAHAHDQGLIHRDVKPSNLLVTRKGTIKLLDLGLSRLLASIPSDDDLTTSGQILGTADYLPPEQAEGSAAIDARSDLYSLGCTLFHLLTGRPPYGGVEFPNFPSKIVAHSQRPFPSARALCDEIPREVEQLLTRLTAKKLQYRPESAAEVSAALGPFCAGADLPRLIESKGSDVPPAPTGCRAVVGGAARAKQAAPRRWRWIPAIACAALVVTILVVVSLIPTVNRTSQPRTPSQGRNPTAHVDTYEGTSERPQETVASPVAVEKATVYVRSNEDDSTLQKLTLRPDNSDLALALPTLGANDDFKLDVEFDRAADWYLLWFDTAGKVTLAARSEQPEISLEYPPGSNMVGVNPADPQGTHLLLLLTGDRSAGAFGQELETRMANIGPPPDMVSGHLVGLRGPRGPGRIKPTLAELNVNYYERIEERLPDGIRWAQKFYLMAEP